MEKILFVDDEPNILNAFRRKLSQQYDFLAANSAKDALTIINSNPDLSVIVSDMAMPEMNGAEFLKECNKKAPDSVRIMLTGLSDQKTAAKAINEANVYRFINKPVSLEDLENILNDAVAHSKLKKQEKDLLQNTVGGIVKLLTDLIGFVDPEGTDQSNRVRRIVKDFAGRLSIPYVELELAAMLYGVGRLSLPLELLLKQSQNIPFDQKEQALLVNCMRMSPTLLKGIPRFEKIVFMMQEDQDQAASKSQLYIQSRIFKIAKKIVELNLDQQGLEEAAKVILPDLNQNDQQILTLILKTLHKSEPPNNQSFSISLSELCPGQRILNDVTDSSGRLLLKKGFLITPAVIEKLKNHSELIGINSSFLVNERIPTKDSE